MTKSIYSKLLIFILLISASFQLNARCNWANVNTSWYTSVSGGKITVGLNSKIDPCIQSSWSLSGTTYIKGASTTFTVTKNGSYKICMKLIDTCHKCDTVICKEVKVDGIKADPPSCSIDFTATVSKDGVKFKPEFKGCNGTATYSWSFGNGTSSTNYDPFVKYAKGTYEVCLTAKCSVYNQTTKKYEICESKICKKVVIKENPCELKGDFSYKIGDKGEVTFTGSSNDKHALYVWTIGNTVKKGKDFKMTLSPGLHKICLTIYNPKSNCKVTICKTIEIPKPKEECKIDFIATITKDGVKFKPEFKGCKGNASYSWHFGNGTSSTNYDPFVKYAKGTYEVCLYAKCSVYNQDTKKYEICESKICKKIVIKESPCELKGDFSYKIGDKNEVTFIGSSNDKHAVYEWVIDNNHKKGMDFKMTLTPGFHKICLTIYNQRTKCKVIICKTIEIKGGHEKCILPAGWHQSNSTCSSYVFEGYNVNNSTPNPCLKYSWDFGDKTTATGKATKHVFANSGTYTVCMKVIDTCKKCDTVICKQIKVDCSTKCTLEGSFKDSISCNRIFLIPSSNSKCSTLSYRYLMLASGTNNVVVKETKLPMFEGPKAGGSVKVCLYLTDNCTGCKDTICKYFTLKACCNANVSAEFSDTLKVGGVVKFVNHSTNGVTYKWLFGDNTSSTDKNISHTYANAGGYKVCLIAYDSSKNCTDTFCKYIQVIIKRGSQASVKRLKGDNVWQLYPNPVSDEVTINGFEFINGDVISIKDMTGKTIQVVNITQNMTSVNMQLGNIVPGLYTIEFQTINGQMINSILIKQ